MQAAPTGLRLRPLRVTELLDTVFSLYRRNFWLFVAVIALVQVPYQVVADLLGTLVTKSTVHARAGQTLTSAQLHSLLLTVLGLIAIASVLTLINIAVVVPLQTAAFTKAVADRFLDRPVTATSCYRFAVRRWGWLVLLGLVYLGLTLAALVVLGLLAFVMVLLLGKGGAVLSVLVVLVGLVAAAIVYVRLVVATPALVLEGLHPWSALRRSWQLTAGDTWRAFFVLVSLLLVEALVGLALGILVGLLTGAAGGAGSGAEVVVRDLASMVVAVLVAPVLASGLTLLYFDLRVRKEAFDLELLAQQISQGPGPS